MVETIIVSVLVGGALVLAARSLYRTLSGKSDGCACGGASCPFADVCGDVERSACDPSGKRPPPQRGGAA